tara:strand:+ start:837 stop:1517 length:681 start_codon:yes stop_codon:yes gene_type:complete
LILIKRIACLATLVKSAHKNHHSERVFSAFETARIFNKENNINGSFLIKDTITLQVLEGDSDALAKVIYRINRDPGITAVSIILNKEIKQPAFSRWSIKLLDDDPSHHTPYIKKMHALLQADLRFPSEADKEMFRYLFDFASEQPLHPSAQHKKPCSETINHEHFNHTTLSMKSWPCPTKLRLTAPLMKISSILIGHSVSYQRLVELQLFSSEAELQKNVAAVKTI